MTEQHCPVRLLKVNLCNWQKDVQSTELLVVDLVDLPIILYFPYVCTECQSHIVYKVVCFMHVGINYFIMLCH
jgi:hypothetical protein